MTRLLYSFTNFTNLIVQLNLCNWKLIVPEKQILRIF